METLFDSSNIVIRIMNYDDITPICKADNDESEENERYLTNQLANQDKQECSALLALYNGKIAGYLFLYYKCNWGGFLTVILFGLTA